MSILLTVSGTSSTITNFFDRPILDPKKNYELAMLSLETYYSLYNIQTTNNNFRYSTDSGATWNLIEITPGAYGLTALNNEVQRLMKAAGHWDSAGEEYYITIRPNTNTLRTVLEITNTDYRVDFQDSSNPGNFRAILGFSEAIYFEPYQESQVTANIQPVNSIRVNCSDVQGSYNNTRESRCIHSFFPTSAPGSKIVENPFLKVYQPLTPYIGMNSITIWLTDQNDQSISFNGETISVNLHIREV